MQLDQISHVIEVISRYAWGLPTIILLVGTGIFLTLRMGFIQFRAFWHSINLLRGKYDKVKQLGEISRFQALMTSLSGTVGTGNIVGVATALALGGPGAMFWMWIAAIFGMATKFTSCTLALKYRETDKDGNMAGGPMYTLKNGLNMPKLGAIFAIFAMIASLGTGNTVQANSIMDSIHYIFPATQAYNLVIVIVLAMSVGLVIVGGVKRISKVCSIIIPVMATLYCIFALIIIILNYQVVPHIFGMIFNLALNPHAAGAGALGAAIRYGVARGIFSNEAGLGSAPIAHAAAKTKLPIQQGMIGMLDPFFDTVVICTMTALVILIGQQAGPINLRGMALSAKAFEIGLQSMHIGHVGGLIVGIGLLFFAYSTIITWSYYGDRCAEYLFGEKAVLPFRIFFTALVAVGALAPLQLVWQLADISNILMAIPNLISLLLLSKVMHKIVREYFDKKQ